MFTFYTSFQSFSLSDKKTPKVQFLGFYKRMEYFDSFIYIGTCSVILRYNGIFIGKNEKAFFELIYLLLHCPVRALFNLDSGNVYFIRRCGQVL